MDNFKYVNFQPWVGDKYREQDFKIMHLGESFYLWKEIINDHGEENARKKVNEWKDFSTTVIEEYLKGDSKQPTYTKACRIFSDDDREIVWDKVIFYNFFQEVVGSSSKDKKYISPSLIEQSQKALYEILEMYKPNLIIVWGAGKLNYKWLPDHPFEYTDKDTNVWSYNAYPNIFFWTIYHPAAPVFNRRYGQGWYRNMFEKIKKYILNQKTTPN